MRNLRIDVFVRQTCVPMGTRSTIWPTHFMTSGFGYMHKCLRCFEIVTDAPLTTQSTKLRVNSHRKCIAPSVWVWLNCLAEQHSCFREKLLLPNSSKPPLYQTKGIYEHSETKKYWLIEFEDMRRAFTLQRSQALFQNPECHIALFS